jgi:shikimate kinase
VAKNIILIGFMGVGKDTLGKILADHLGLSFVSTDILVEKKQNKTISAILKEHGENFFHNLEFEILKLLIKEKKPMVISTGGEIVLNEDSLKMLPRLGFVVYIHTNSKEIAERMIRTPNPRPQFQGLKGKELFNKVLEMIASHEKYYKSICDLSIETTHKSPLEIVDEIKDTWATLT